MAGTGNTFKEERKDPDKLSSLFIKVSDDLSYARTFYPNRYVRSLSERSCSATLSFPLQE
ncbi:MAG: hypothetical protein U0X76_04920 [Bacteroidia bacterium]